MATDNKMRAQRSQAGLPGGAARLCAFPSQLRAQLVSRDGKSFFEVTGYASVFNRGYEMWDMFGSYNETVDGAAFNDTLSRNPDVAFLVNHRGVTMARTTNGSLELTKDTTGLGQHAFLNAERQDVRDLASAINDELVTEMSFAFILEDGMWNDDCSEFRIMKVSIDRGDVSAVNYGASPWTSIEARSAEFIALTKRMPAFAAQAAYARLGARDDVVITVETPAVPAVEPEPAGTEEPETGHSVDLVKERRKVPATGYSINLVSGRRKMELVNE
jgi:HK97 family phage prohead protease